jgi:hypothetical protein
MTVLLLKTIGNETRFIALNRAIRVGLEYYKEGMRQDPKHQYV